MNPTDDSAQQGCPCSTQVSSLIHGSVEKDCARWVQMIVPEVLGVVLGVKSLKQEYKAEGIH